MKSESSSPARNTADATTLPDDYSLRERSREAQAENTKFSKSRDDAKLAVAVPSNGQGYPASERSRSSRNGRYQIHSLAGGLSLETALLEWSLGLLALSLGVSHSLERAHTSRVKMQWRWSWIQLGRSVRRLALGGLWLTVNGYAVLTTKRCFFGASLNEHCMFNASTARGVSDGASRPQRAAPRGVESPLSICLTVSRTML